MSPMRPQWIIGLVGLPLCLLGSTVMLLRYRKAVRGNEYAGAYKLVRKLAGHTAAEFNGLAVSPDGRRVATASSDTSLGVFDIESGTLADQSLGLRKGRLNRP